MKRTKTIYLISSLLFTFYCTISYSQMLPIQDILNAKTTEADSIPNVLGGYADSLLNVYHHKNLTAGRKIMTKEYFDKFFNRYFSYLSTNKVGLPDGNSLSLQPTSNSTRLQANLSHKSLYTIYNFGIQADYSDNIANILSSKDITTNTTFYTNISFLNTGSRILHFDANAAINNNLKKIYLINQFKDELNLKYNVNYSADSLLYADILQQVDTLIKIQNANPTAANSKKIIELKDKLNKAMAKVNAYGLNETDAMYSVNGIINDATKQLKDSLKKILDDNEINNDAWNSFNFSWFSAGLTYTKQQYNTYDSMLVFANRMSTAPFNNTGITIGYNYISQRSDKYLKIMNHKLIQSFYLNAAYTLSNDLNYSHITPQDVVTLKQVRSGDTIYQFQSSSKIRDISNQARSKSWLHTTGLQSTIILSRTNLMGFTMAINGAFGKFIEPIYGGRLGLLLRFLNSDDQKSKVNLEIFLQLNDWADSGNSGKSTWQRKTIGFNTTIPFNKLFF